MQTTTEKIGTETPPTAFILKDNQGRLDVVKAAQVIKEVLPTEKNPAVTALLQSYSELLRLLWYWGRDFAIDMVNIGQGSEQDEGDTEDNGPADGEPELVSNSVIRRIGGYDEHGVRLDSIVLDRKTNVLLVNYSNSKVASTALVNGLHLSNVHNSRDGAVIAEPVSERLAQIVMNDVHTAAEQDHEVADWVARRIAETETDLTEEETNKQGDNVCTTTHTLKTVVEVDIEEGLAVHPVKKLPMFAKWTVEVPTDNHDAALSVAWKLIQAGLIEPEFITLTKATAGHTVKQLEAFQANGYQLVHTKE